MRFGPFGLPEIAVIIVVVLLVFGSQRLPEMARGIGQSLREFRKAVQEVKHDISADEQPENTAVSKDVTTTIATDIPQTSNVRK